MRTPPLRRLFVPPRRWTKVVATALGVALFCWPAGCGSDGGTSGSGGGGFGISGVLRTVGQAPVAGVQVAVVNTGSGVVRVSLSTSSPGNPAQTSKASTSDVTDHQGEFSLRLDSRPTTLSLRFQGDTFDSTVDVANIPSAAATVNLNLLLDEATETVEEESESFEDEAGEQVP